MAWIEAEGRPGFFRVAQTKRMIRAERIDGKLRLDRKHAGSKETLERSVQAFERGEDQRDKWGQVAVGQARAQEEVRPTTSLRPSSLYERNA
jgi:hypothetical protein